MWTSESATLRVGTLMNTPQIRLLLVDDNKRLTSAWERLIGQQPDMELVGTLDRADGLVGAAQEKSVDVILIDLTMEGRDPLEAVAEVTRECPGIHTLIYSARSRSEWHDQAKRAGAKDFLDKADDPNAILEAIRRVSRRTKQA
jgi:DNA-binding NarL/FixJ family response regulator